MSVRRHTAYNLVGLLTPMVLALVAVPLYLGIIGEARYGALALVWLLVGYFSLFDLGLGAATAQRLATLAEASPAARAHVFWSALLANRCFGVLGSLIAWPLARWFFEHSFTIDANLRAELLVALPWMLVTLPVATLSGVLSGTLQARQRFFELNLTAVIGGAAVQLLPLLAALHLGPQLEHLVQAVLLARLLTTVTLMQRCTRHVTQGHPMTWRLATARDLLRYGGWVSVSAVVGPLMVILDRFVIGWLLNARAVSHYTIPFQLAERATVLSASLNQALFPRMAQTSSEAARTALADRASRVLVITVSPLVALALVLMDPFLGWWISADMATVATPVAHVLLLGFWINSLAMVPHTQLQAAGRPDLVAKCHLAELLPYLALMFYALQTLGLVGAAIVFAVRAATDFVLLALLARSLSQRLKLLSGPALALLVIATCGGHGPLAYGLLLALWIWAARLLPQVLRPIAI